MQLPDMLALFDREMRANLSSPSSGFRCEQAGKVIRLIGPSASAHDNCITFSRLEAAAADAAIEDQIAYFGTRRRAFEWKVYGHDTPPDLAARLLRRGFVAEGRETVVVRDLALHVPEPPMAQKVAIGAVKHAAQLSDVAAVHDRVWNESHDWLRDALAAEMNDDPTRIEILLAAIDGAGPVAASWMHLHQGTTFASIWGAATLPAFRRRGIYSALVERHAATARRHGARLLTADANDNSRPVLERIGFRPLAEVQGFIWQPPA